MNNEKLRNHIEKYKVYYITGTALSDYLRGRREHVNGFTFEKIGEMH